MPARRLRAPRGAAARPARTRGGVAGVVAEVAAGVVAVRSRVGAASPTCTTAGPWRCRRMDRRRLVRVPASSANLGPGFDCMAAAVGLHLQVEVRETGQLLGADRPAGGARAREPVRTGVRAAASRRRVRVHDLLGDTAGRRPGVERRGDCRGADGGRPPVRAGRRSARAGQRAGGSSRQRRRRPARRVRRLRGRAGDAL